MSTQQVFRLRNPVLLMALAAVFPVISYAAGAANIDFAAGSVTAVNAAGVQRPLTKGAEISNGDTIRTGEGGRAQVRFSDGAMVSLQPQTDFRIDNYQYSGKADGQEKGFFSLLKGGLRTITGLVGRSNRDNYKVVTSVATIGIRGTEYTGALNPGTGELVVNTGEGLVEVCNGAGCVLLASGESGSVQGNNAPRRTDSRPQLPPAQPENSLLPVFTTGDTLAGVYVPTSPMPTTGTATYSSFVSTTPVLESGGVWTPGTLNSASVAVNFGTLAVSTSLAGTVNAQSFSASGSGSISGNTLAASLSVSGAVCGCGCSGSLSGTFYGQAASQVGISYSIAGIKTFGGSAILAK
jgi:hypothetical protein